MRNPLLIAIRFLSRLPAPSSAGHDEITVGQSALFYPLVGALFALLLIGTQLLLVPIAAPSLAAALLLALWVLLSGGLHLDGLADSVDAWIGGLGNRDRMLAIMKDPYSGPAGVTALLLVLLLKYTALLSLCQQHSWSPLLLTPILARTALILLFLTTPYIRPSGMGSTLAAYLPRRPAWIIITMIMSALSIIALPGSLIIMASVLLGFMLLRHMMIQRLGGTTGDTAGAMVELLEMLLLVTAALLPASWLVI
ncbi:MAG: adenosylcobinamide-GDP ribazoletransferase [Gammaproteobacteria bacterium]|nr:adenosylcobinamide-GDP ribazoletransferase [Gammaproteobacteria bacterium]